MSTDMRFQYGAAVSDANTVRVSNRSVTPYLMNGYTVAWTHRLVIEGFVYATGPIPISTAMQSLQNALTVPNQSGGITSNGVPTNHWLTNVGALDGVEVENFNWLDSPTALATEAKYTVTIRATYGNAGEVRDGVELRETVSVAGEGGAVSVLVPQATARAIYQTISQYSTVGVVQQGTAVARFGWPIIPSPIILTSGARQVRNTRNVREVIQLRTGVLGYRISYSYQFELPSHPGSLTPNVLT